MSIVRAGDDEGTMGKACLDYNIVQWLDLEILPQVKEVETPLVDPDP
jgi:hypothetical protein